MPAGPLTSPPRPTLVLVEVVKVGIAWCDRKEFDRTRHSRSTFHSTATFIIVWRTVRTLLTVFRACPASDS